MQDGSMGGQTRDNSNKIGLVEDIATAAGALLMDLFDERASSQEADVASQKLIVEKLAAEFPDVPILAEEQTGDPHILSVSDDTTNLPPTYWSVDPLDGSAVFDNKCSEWAVSIALIQDYKPVLCAIRFPRFDITVEAIVGEGTRINGKIVRLQDSRPPEKWLIGIDLCKAVDDEFTTRVILPLIKKFRYVRNFPTVASNLELLLGHTGLWISNNVRNWDIAAAALAVQEAGGIVQQLDGKPINWKLVRMPALVAVANKEMLELLPG